MKFTILAHGTRGDVQPYVALGVGLMRAGHSVRLAAPELFRPFVADYGLEFAPLAGDPRTLMLDAVEKAGGRPNLFRIAPVVLKYVAPIARQVMQDARQACHGSDAIVHSFLTTLVGHEIALELGVPDFSALVFAIFAPTAAFPGPSFPDLRLGRTYNRLTHQVFSKVFWLGGRLAYRWIIRRRDPQSPPLSEWPFQASNQRPTPILFGFSPHVIPKPPDWGEHVHVTGFWFLEAQAQWSPPPALLEFLEGGSPPVFVGFGSVIARDAERLTEIALTALAQTGQRGILLTGWGGLASASLPDSVFMLENAPFDWLFPRVAATVIHGGIGTTAASMRAGVPTIVVPFTADQTFWGAQVSRCGVGPPPIPHRRLKAANLAGAIRCALEDQALRQRARDLGQLLRAEDGVATAIEVLENELQS